MKGNNRTESESTTSGSATIVTGSERVLPSRMPVGRIGSSELASPERKRRYNQRLFAIVAPRYDLVTRLLSFGRDAAWKRRLVRSLPGNLPEQERQHGRKRQNGRKRQESLNAKPVVLDLACGTGDITLLLADRYPGGLVTGIDITEGMLQRARRRAGSRAAVRFLRGDMDTLKNQDGTVDIVTGGYALRNAPDLNHTLHEIHRVLRPGGVAAFLEFSLPRSPTARALQLRLLRFWGQLWGFALHRDPEVYAYIARSLARYPHVEALEALFRRAGFTVLAGRSLMLGFARITRLRKEVSRGS